MCNCAKFIAIEQQSEGICCCSPLFPLALFLSSSRTVNKNRLHVKLCLASVKRSSTIDSNRPEHDVASVPPPAPTTLSPATYPLPHSAQLVLQFCMPFGYTFWLALFAPPLSFWPSPFYLFFGTFIIIFLHFAHFSRFYVFWTLLSRRAAGIK